MARRSHHEETAELRRKRRDRAIMRQLARAQLVGTEPDPEFDYHRPPLRPRDNVTGRILRWLGRVTGLGPRPMPPPGTVTWRLRRKRFFRPVTSRWAKFRLNLLIRLGLRKPYQKVHPPRPPRPPMPSPGPGPPYM